MKKEYETGTVMKIIPARNLTFFTSFNVHSLYPDPLTHDRMRFKAFNAVTYDFSQKNKKTHCIIGTFIDSFKDAGGSTVLKFITAAGLMFVFQQDVSTTELA